MDDLGLVTYIAEELCVPSAFFPTRFGNLLQILDQGSFFSNARGDNQP